MKQITTEERIVVLNNALQGLNAIRALAEMDLTDLELQGVATAGNTQATGAAVVANAPADSTTATELTKSIISVIDALPPITKKGVKASGKPDEKGFRPRNGRMDIIRAVVNKMGAAAKTNELFEKVNEVSVLRGLKPINKTAFYTLVSEVRKQEF